MGGTNNCQLQLLSFVYFPVVDISIFNPNGVLKSEQYFTWI